MFCTSKNAPISAFKNFFTIIYLDLQLFYWLLCYIAFSCCCCPICKFNYVDNYSACRISFTNKQTKKCRTMTSPSLDPWGQRRTSPESCFLIGLECLEAAARTWGTQRRWAAPVTTQEMTSPGAPCVAGSVPDGAGTRRQKQHLKPKEETVEETQRQV